MFTYKRLLISVLIGVILCVTSSIFIIEKMSMVDNNPLITHIFNKDNYDYSFLIPTYWDNIKDTTNDIMFTGNNYEYLSLNLKEKDITYDKSTYGALMSLKIADKYGVEDTEFEVSTKNGIFIYKAIFKVFDNNYVSGYADCGDYLVEFEYKRTDKNDINKSLDTIITSINRFKTKEVIFDE